MGVKEVPIFIASSIVEFKDERTELLAYLGTLNKLYKPRGVRLEWDNPEDMSHEMRPDGSQSEIDEAIRNCEFFFVIVGRDMGKYTLGEFETAWEQRKATGKPKVIPYFLPPPYEITHPSVSDFYERLKGMEHYCKVCRSMTEVKEEMHIELIRGGAFDVQAAPSSKEETVKKGQEAARGLVQEQRDKIAKLKKKPVTPDIVAETTDAYEEIRRLAQTYKIEPDALLDYMVFLWKQHLYDTGIEIGQWLENFYRLDKDTDEAAWARLKRQLGDCYDDSNRKTEGERYYREALEIWRRLAKANPAAFEPDLAGTCENLGVLLYSTNRMEEAEEHYGEALEIWRRLAKANSIAYEPHLSEICNNLGLLMSDTNRMEEAEARYGEALEIRRRLAQANPAAYEPYLAITCNNLGNLLKNTNRMEEAEALYGEALEIYRRLAKANPAAYEPYLAGTCYNMGLFEWQRDNLSAVKRYFEEALSLYEKFPHHAQDAQDCRDRLNFLDLFAKLSLDEGAN